MRRVVVTGMGAITPIGNSVDEFGRELKQESWNRRNYQIRHNRLIL